jgi:UDP:flavonoid glycosyltransferase YjiC (YdhE family)
VSRILFAWELGGNLGHLTRMLALARPLRARGHEVSFALPNPAALSEQFPAYKAPTPRSSGADLPREPASYPEILLHYGFADAAALTAALRAWRALYAEAAPDLIVFDHAPTALLAARATGIPRVVCGTGFACPPRVSPMPSIRPWQDIPRERLMASEQRALKTANAALCAIGAKPMDFLHELSDVEENILATLPELDHYGARPNTKYWGPISDDSNGIEPPWPDGEGKKLFVYIRPTSMAFRPLAALLQLARLRTVWFAPGIRRDVISQLESPSLRIVCEPVSVPLAASSADAAVLHGGHSTTAAMLLAGVPVLLLPEHVEQFLIGRNAAALGVGAALNLSTPAPQLPSILEALIGDPRYEANARVFAQRHSPACAADVACEIEKVQLPMAAEHP